MKWRKALALAVTKILVSVAFGKTDRAACRAELLKRTDRERVGDYERRFMEDCMQQRGYQLVSEKDLPLDVKREEPDIPSEVPIARGYGVAGSLPK